MGVNVTFWLRKRGWQRSEKVSIPIEKIKRIEGVSAVACCIYVVFDDPLPIPPPRCYWGLSERRHFVVGSATYVRAHIERVAKRTGAMVRLGVLRS